MPRVKDNESLDQTSGTERRRSLRTTRASAVHVLGLGPSPAFSEHCTTVDVGSEGCRFRASRPFQHEDRLHLTILADGTAVTGHVVYSLPIRLDSDKMAWRVGVKFDAPGNYWEVESPPPDWLL